MTINQAPVACFGYGEPKPERPMRERLARAVLFGPKIVGAQGMSEEDRERYFSGPAGAVAFDYVDMMLDEMMKPSPDVIAACLRAVDGRHNQALITVEWQAMIQAIKEGK